MVVIVRALQASSINLVSHILSLDRADCFCMCNAHVLELVVRLRVQAVREGHFHKVSSEQPSDGPIVMSSPLKCVQHHSGGHWPTSVCEVHWGHELACTYRGPCFSAVSCWPHLSCVDHIPCVARVGIRTMFHVRAM